MLARIGAAVAGRPHLRGRAGRLHRPPAEPRAPHPARRRRRARGAGLRHTRADRALLPAAGGALLGRADGAAVAGPQRPVPAGRRRRAARVPPPGERPPNVVAAGRRARPRPARTAACAATWARAAGSRRTGCKHVAARARPADRRRPTATRPRRSCSSCSRATGTLLLGDEALPVRPAVSSPAAGHRHRARVPGRRWRPRAAGLRHARARRHLLLPALEQDLLRRASGSSAGSSTLDYWDGEEL